MTSYVDVYDNGKLLYCVSLELHPFKSNQVEKQISLA